MITNNETKRILVNCIISTLQNYILPYYNEKIITETNLDKIVDTYFSGFDKERIKRIFKYNLIFNEPTMAACYEKEDSVLNIIQKVIDTQRKEKQKYLWTCYYHFYKNICFNNILYFPERILLGYLSEIIMNNNNDTIPPEQITTNSLFKFICSTIGHERRHFIQNKRCMLHRDKMCSKLSTRYSGTDDYMDILSERDAEWYGHQFAISLMFD